MFITIEGGEGSGKTTQTKLLVKFLQDKGYDVFQTHEPGGTIIGKKIRNILLNPENVRITNLTELLLYQADRAQHIEEIIRPALKRGKDAASLSEVVIVVCDRFYDATIAYQGFGRQLDKNLIEQMNALICGQIKPNLTIVLDIDAKEGLKRAIKREKESGVDRIELEKLEFHQRVRQGYLEIAKREPERVKIIDASKDIEDIYQDICCLVNEWLISN